MKKEDSLNSTIDLEKCLLKVNDMIIMHELSQPIVYEITNKEVKRLPSKPAPAELLEYREYIVKKIETAKLN
jgi:hypothetical protein